MWFGYSLPVPVASLFLVAEWYADPLTVPTPAIRFLPLRAITMSPGWIAW